MQNCTMVGTPDDRVRPRLEFSMPRQRNLQYTLMPEHEVRIFQQTGQIVESRNMRGTEMSPLREVDVCAILGT